MKNYEIRVHWITNDFVTVNRVYDYTGKEFSFVMDEFNLISNQLYDLMNKGKIKTYQAHIAWQ